MSVKKLNLNFLHSQKTFSTFLHHIFLIFILHFNLTFILFVILFFCIHRSFIFCFPDNFSCSTYKHILRSNSQFYAYIHTHTYKPTHFEVLTTQERKKNNITHNGQTTEKFKMYIRDPKKKIKKQK